MAPRGTNTINYQFFLPEPNSPDWGTAMNDFITVVDRDLAAVMGFFNNGINSFANLQGQIDSLKTNLILAHINKGTDAHAASAISETGRNNVQAALDELRTQVEDSKRRIIILEANNGASATGSPLISGNFDIANGSTAGLVNFSATASSNAGDIVAYDWKFGDGAVAQGAVVSHIYANTGPYTIVLNLTDSAGNTKMISKRVSPPASAGAGNIQASFTAVPNTTDFTTGGLAIPGRMNFTATASTDVGTVAAIEWNFGDESSASLTQSQVGLITTHTFRGNGPYLVTLVVRTTTGASKAVQQTIVPPPQPGVKIKVTGNNMVLPPPTLDNRDVLGVVYGFAQSTTGYTFFLSGDQWLGGLTKVRVAAVGDDKDPGWESLLIHPTEPVTITKDQSAVSVTIDSIGDYAPVVDYYETGYSSPSAVIRVFGDDRVKGGKIVLCKNPKP